MSRPEYCRFMPGKWRSATMFMDLEHEGLLIRIAAFNMETGLALPDVTTAARILHVHHHKLRKLLSGLIHSGDVVHDENGIYSPRAMAECARAEKLTKRSKTDRDTAKLPPIYPSATPVLPQCHSGATPPVDGKKSEQILRARLEEKRREEKKPPKSPLPEQAAETAAGGGAFAQGVAQEPAERRAADEAARQAYLDGERIKQGAVAKSARSVTRTNGELDGSGGITLTPDGELRLDPATAASLARAFPKIEVQAVCHKAAPEVCKLGWPTTVAAKAVLRKWAQIETDRIAERKPSERKRSTDELIRQFHSIAGIA